MRIKVLRLCNGEDIVGGVEEWGDDQYLITAPMHVVEYPITKYKEAVEPWRGVSLYDTVPIRRDHVIVCVEPYPYHHRLEAIYLEHLKLHHPTAYEKVV